MVMCKDIINLIRVCDTCDSDLGVRAYKVFKGEVGRDMYLCKECSNVLLKSETLTVYKKY